MRLRPGWKIPTPDTPKQDVPDGEISIRSYVIHCALVSVALLSVQVRLAPLCMEVYSQWGKPLPSLTLAVLNAFPKEGAVVTLIVSLVVTLAGAGLYSKSTEGSSSRKAAWFLPSVGMAVLIFTLLALFIPLLGLSGA